MINLEIIGESYSQAQNIGGNRIRHLSRELEKNDVIINYHELPPGYRRSKIKIVKRFRLRNTLYKQIISKTRDRDVKNTVFLVTSPPTIYAPILNVISKRYCTILDLRDTYQEWEYHSFLKRRIEKWEQCSAMKRVESVTYAHENFRPHLVKDGVSPNKLYFVTNGANSDIFSFKGNRKTLSDSKIDLIYAGGILHYHDFSKWIEVMRYLQKQSADVHLTIIGKGNDSMRVGNKIQEYRLSNVTFQKEKINQKELSDYIRGADYALASINSNLIFYYNVNILTKIYEALSCGVPFLSFAGEATDIFSKQFDLCRNWTTKNELNFEEISHEIANLPPPRLDERKALAKKAHSTFSFKIIAMKFKEILEQSLRKHLSTN
ncbi:MAG: glycosyltransferase [Candidatus Hodarchaeales archaeon]